jgi:hypothetical protein
MLMYRQGRIVSVSLSFPNSGQEMHILQKQIDQKKRTCAGAVVQDNWRETTDEQETLHSYVQLWYSRWRSRLCVPLWAPACEATKHPAVARKEGHFDRSRQSPTLRATTGTLPCMASQRNRTTNRRTVPLHAVLKLTPLCTRMELVKPSRAVYLVTRYSCL